VFFDPWLIDVLRVFESIVYWQVKSLETEIEQNSAVKRAALLPLFGASRSYGIVWLSLVDAILTVASLNVGATPLHRWHLHSEMGITRADVLVSLCSNALHGSASANASLRIVELGVAQGSTGSIILERCPGVQYLGVDPFENDSAQFEVAASNLRNAAPHSATWNLAMMTSSEAAASVQLWREGWSRDIDVLFVDTEKYEYSTLRDILLWSPRVRPCGCVAGHDFSSFWMNVAESVLESVPVGKTLHFGSDHTWWWFTGDCN